MSTLPVKLTMSKPHTDPPTLRKPHSNDYNRALHRRPNRPAKPEPVTLSIGANLFDQPPTSLVALIEQGDAALYESKRGGRDSIRVVDRTVASADPLRTR